MSEDGVVVRGAVVEAAGTEVPGEGLFTVRRDLKSLAAAKGTLTGELGALDLEIEDTASAAGTLAVELEDSSQALRAKEREHSEAEARTAAARDERLRAEREAALLGDEDTQLRSDLVKAGEARSEATRIAAQRGAEMATIERTIGELEQGVEGTRAARLAAAEGRRVRAHGARRPEGAAPRRGRRLRVGTGPRGRGRAPRGGADRVPRRSSGARRARGEVR